jgi:hypothetical protein
MTEIFQRPRLNVIESSSGFSVEVMDQTEILYRRRGRALRLSSELLAGPAGIAVYPDSLRNWDEPPGVPIDADDLTSILDDLRRAFRWRGYEIQIISAEPRELEERGNTFH